jgi:hypothetical protein
VIEEHTIDYGEVPAAAEATNRGLAALKAALHRG